MVQPIVIAGPTGSGKSDLAMQLALRLGGELVCADSRQFFDGMQIGSAGPTPEELKKVPHHLFGVIAPKSAFDAGSFVEAADRAVAEISSRNKVPILVGGTGLYLRAWRYGLSDVPAKDDNIRRRLNSEIEQLGKKALHDRLRAFDEVSAAQISENDQVRIVRALEIIELTQKKPSDLRVSHASVEPRVNAKWVLLFPEKGWLSERLAIRVRQMYDKGLVDEAVALEKRLPAEHPLLRTMGFEEAIALAHGRSSKEEAIATTLRRHVSYAKRQMTWFKKETWWQVLDPSRENFANESFLNRVSAGSMPVA